MRAEQRRLERSQNIRKYPRSHANCWAHARSKSIGGISALFPDFQRYPEPCQTGPGTIPKSRARRIPSDSALSEPIEQPLKPRCCRRGPMRHERRWAAPRAERDLKSIFFGSVKQADRPGRRPAFRPQAGEILAGQVLQDSLDDRQVFSAGESDGAVCQRQEAPERSRCACRREREFQDIV